MRLVHQAMVTHKTVKALTRTCRECRQRQVIPGSKARETVKCKKCGAALAPESRRP